MACEYTCDGCGKKETADVANHRYVKPLGWWQRSDDDGIQVACSRQCIDKVAQQSGKTACALPF